eukprot:g3338.t1
MWSFIIPVSLVLILATISNYAPLHIPFPFEQHQIKRNPVWNRPGPLTGNLSVNHELEKGLNLFENKIVAPETIIFDKDGAMYLFTEKGIFTAAPNGDGFHDPVLLVKIEGGRPLSGEFDSEGNIYFCDVILGLGIVDVDKKSYEILVSSDEIHFCDDLVVSSKGDVYIGDSSQFHTLEADKILLTCQISVLSGETSGRLLKYTLSTKSLEVLLSNLTFIGGIELSSDESYILVNEGPRLNVLKHWLEGPLKHTTEVFIENLPGYGDGIRKGSNSTYWIAIFEVMGYAHQVLLTSRLLRWLAFQTPPEIVASVIVSHGLIIQTDEKGVILRSLHDTSGAFGMTTSVIERNGKIYIGSFNKYVKVINL